MEYVLSVFFQAFRNNCFLALEALHPSIVWRKNRQESNGICISKDMGSVEPYNEGGQLSGSKRHLLQHG